jgi:hypothetical protein
MHKVCFTIIILVNVWLTGVGQKNNFQTTDTIPLSGSPVAEGQSIHRKVASKNFGEILSDTTLYILTREIPEDSVAQFKKDKRFAYMHNLDSLLKESQQSHDAELDNTGVMKRVSFFQRLLSSGLMEMVFWVIALAFVGLILYRLFLSNGIFVRKTKSSPFIDLPGNNIQGHAIDYEGLVHQSCKLGDYRVAIRYLYLRTLSKLAERELLHLSPEKTNVQYVKEIGRDKQDEFASLVLTYEYVWYGHFPVTQSEFTGMEKKYQSFFQKLL